MNEHVFIVEHRRKLTELVHDCDVAFIASTLERAEAWAQANTDYDEHEPEYPWLFAITREAVDREPAPELVCFYGWDGSRHEDFPAYFADPELG